MESEIDARPALAAVRLVKMIRFGRRFVCLFRTWRAGARLHCARSFGTEFFGGPRSDDPMHPGGGGGAE